MEFETGGGSPPLYEELYEELLDDRKRVAGDAQIYMGSRMVGYPA